MEKLVFHNFVSPSADGNDPKRLQPSYWNDGHKFSGGVNGQVLERDDTAESGAKWADIVVPAHDHDGVYALIDHVHAEYAALSHSHAWADVSKVGAVPGDIGAAAASHTHAWADVSKVGSSLADLATRAVANLSDGSNVALKNAQNLFVSGQVIGDGTSAAALKCDGALGSGKGLLWQVGGVTVGQLLNINDSVVIDGGGSLTIRTANGATTRLEVTSSGQLKERGRSVAMGEWTAPTWDNSYLVTPSGSLSSVSCTTYAYTLIGKTLFWTFDITATVTGGSFYLTLALPGGLVAARRQFGTCMASAGAGNFACSVYSAGSGVTSMMIQHPSGNWSGACVFSGAIAIEVQ